MHFEIAEKNYRGMKVIFFIVFIIFGFILISIIEKNRNFNNDQINGTFSGNVSYPDQVYQVKISFNGLGKINGSISNQSIFYIFSGEYSFVIGDSENVLIFGFITELNVFEFICSFFETITGKTQMSSRDESNKINGSVFLSKI